MVDGGEGIVVMVEVRTEDRKRADGYCLGKD